MGSEDDNLQILTKDRMASLATAKASAERLKSAGETGSLLGQRQSVPMGTARPIVAEWPPAPQKTAATVLDHYGAANEATPTKLFWYRVGAWSRMELTADEVVHNSPTPHTDYFTYPVDATKAAELVAFDRSVIIDRTTGELGARCDHEAYNTLTLNLAVDIVTGQRTVDDARMLYAETASAYVMGRDAPYAEHLRFTPPTGIADPDEAMIAASMADQMAEKVKDGFGAGETPK